MRGCSYDLKRSFGVKEWWVKGPPLYLAKLPQTTGQTQILKIIGTSYFFTTKFYFYLAFWTNSEKMLYFPIQRITLLLFTDKYATSYKIVYCTFETLKILHLFFNENCHFENP